MTKKEVSDKNETLGMIGLEKALNERNIEKLGLMKVKAKKLLPILSLRDFSQGVS